MKKFIKNLSVFDIIICILFIVVNILSIILFGCLGLLALPILSLLIFIYFYPNRIVILFKNFRKKLLKKKKKKNKNNKNNKNKKTNSSVNNKKKMKNYSVDEEFEEDNIILKDDKKEKDIENVYETRVDNVKKVNKKNIKSRNSKKTNKKNTKKGKVVSKKKETKRKLWKVLLSGFLIFCIICILSVAAFLGYIVITTENFDPDKLTYQDQTKVYDKDGKVFATLGTEKRESITYEKLPQVLVDAIIATEDSRFFEHNGVDFARFLKASFQQLLGQSSAGGASTLTMQVSKNNLTSRDASGLEGIIRKFRDVYISVFQIEKKYTKEQIIEFYVNDNLLGGSNYGVEQASQYYFNKSASELNLAEAATIAGIFQSPNKYRPDLYPEESEKRRNLVLELMVRHGYITKDEAETTKAISVESLVVARAAQENYQGFLDTVVAEIDDKTGLNPYVVSMEIYTTLDRSIQDGVDDIMDGTTYTWKNDVVQAGLAVVKVDTGEVSAIGAGRNRVGEGKWNYATQARRHPGSTAKPLFDYAPGFEFSNYSTYTLFNDEPWNYTDGPAVNNWDSGFRGLMTLKDAVAISRNIPALKAFQQNNKTNIYNFVTSLGIKPESPLHEAHAIGGFTGVTPLEMSAAYAAFANGGYYIEPHTVTKIVYRDSGEVEEFKYTKERVMEASTAFLMNNVLQYAVTNGFDGGAKVYGKTTAAKTGTSTIDSATLEKNGIPDWAVNDLWTAAYTPEYSFSVWYGYEELTKDYYNTSNDNGYKEGIMRQLVKSIPMTSKPFEIPNTVVQSQVEFGTWPAKLPSKYTPSDLIRTEYFIRGTQPTEVSDRFDKFDDVKDLKVEEISDNTVELTWNFDTPDAFDEKYLKKYFSQNAFGKGTDGFVKERLNYFGGIGFGIYTKDENGKLTEIDFTTENEYRYTNNTSKDVYLVVKVRYRDYEANASNGVISKILVKGKYSSNNSDNNDTGDSDNSSFTFNNLSYISTTVSGYSEQLVVKYNNRDITSSAKIVYSINGETFSTTDRDEFVNKVNKLEKGTYTLKYEITYQNETIIKTRKLILN